LQRIAIACARRLVALTGLDLAAVEVPYGSIADLKLSSRRLQDMTQHAAARLCDRPFAAESRQLA